MIKLTVLNKKTKIRYRRPKMFIIYSEFYYFIKKIYYLFKDQKAYLTSFSFYA